jgi:hypothetical protein
MRFRRVAFSPIGSPVERPVSTLVRPAVERTLGLPTSSLLLRGESSTPSRDSLRPPPARSSQYRFAAACLFAGLLAAVLLAPVAGCRVLGGASAGSCGDPDWVPSTAGGPPASVECPNGSRSPLLVVRLDRDGRACDSGPLNDVARALNDPGVTDVYVLCPGWASGYTSAVGWMQSFLTGHERVRPFAEADPARPRAYRPVYVGIVWPSDVLVASLPAPPVDGGLRMTRADVDQQALAEVLGADVDPKVLDRLRQALLERGHKARANRLEALLARAAALTPPDHVDLADCLLPLYGPQEEPAVPGPRYAVRAGAATVRRVAESPVGGVLESDPAPVPPLDPRELLEAWKRSVREAAADVPHGPEQPTDDGSRARRGGLQGVELVRWALRATDFRLMKDRAWQVGRRGVAEVLAQVNVSRRGARVHVVGHSFGCDALLAGLSRPDELGCRASPAAPTPTTAPALPPASMPATTAKTTAATGVARPPADAVPTIAEPPADPLVDTLLLLQPTASAWAFAPPPAVGPDVAPGLQQASRGGAYRPAVTGGVCRRVVVTRSDHDWFLGYYAPKAIRRPAYEGQASPDAWAGEGMGFATMGSAGPLGLGSVGLGPVDPAAAQPTGGPAGPADQGTPSQVLRLVPVAGTQAPPRYTWDPTARVVTIDADRFAHGDVNDEAFWWLLANQVETGR